MKKVMLLCAMFVFAGISVNAQSCSKSKKACCKAKKAATTETAATDTQVASAYMVAAEAAAEADENVMKRTCAESGAVGFYKKSMCEKSGKISYDEVKYCMDSKAFVNVSPSEVQSAMMEGEVVPVAEEAPVKKACSKADKKACAKTCKAKAKTDTK